MPHGNVIEVATGMVGIDEACSGIRSFQATLMISLFFGELYALSAVRRALLVLAGFALSFLFNLARTTLLTWVAAKKGVAAIATWHDPAGVTILVACFFCLWGMGVWLRGKRPREVGSLLEYGIDSTGQAISRASACEVENQTSRAKESGEKGTSNIQHPVTRRQTPVVGGQEAEAGTARSSRITHHASRITHPPSLALALALGTWLVISEVSVEAWYRSHETRVPVVAQWTVAWPVNNPVFKELPLPERTRQILRYDEGRSAAWEADGLQWQAVFLRWKPGRTAIHLAQNHTPEVCMTGAGHTLNVISPQEWFEVNGLRMPFLAYQVTDAPRPFFVFYCLWDDRASAQEFETMSLTYGNRLAPVLAGLRNPGQRSLEIAVAGSENAEQAKTVLRGELNKLIVSKP
jgi:exosortase/archaeosortase family protein